MTLEMSCHLVDFSSVPSVCVSLTLGYLQAFAEADPRISGRCQFSKQCRHLDGALELGWNTIRDLIGRERANTRIFAFTNYFWNRQINIALASRIKSVLSDAVIIFGGNEVTNQGHALLGEGSPIDFVVNGEGEVVFANLLAAHIETGMDFSKIRGISFRDPCGQIITTEAQPRIEDLDSIPSPFLTGACSSQDIAASAEVVYEFSRGCPFKCAFCFWGGAVGTRTRRFSLQRIRQDLESIVSCAKNGTRISLADANFGMTDADIAAARTLVQIVRNHNKRIFLFSNWAKNTSRRVVETASILFENHLISGMTLSAQSLNSDVLQIAERKNIPFEYYRQLQGQFHQLGIPTYTELLLGMPGESYESFRDGVDKVICAGGTPFIYPLLLLNNTEYNEPRIITQFGIRSRKMPYCMSNSSTQVETVIGHDRLPYEHWLKGIGLRLAVPLFYCGILKFVMTRLQAVHDVTYGQMFDRLLDFCMRGEVKSHDLFRRVFLNYIASWDSPDQYDLALISGIMQGNTPRDIVHYQALMRVVIDDLDGAATLIIELARVLSDLVEHELCPEFETWIQYQILIVGAIAQAVQNLPGELRTSLSASFLSKYGGDIVAREEGSARLVQVRREYKGAPLDVFVLRISYGSIDTLKIFESFESPPTCANELLTVA